MMQSDVKEKAAAVDNRQCKWRNVIFSTDGITMYGAGLHPTEDAARKGHEKDKRQLMAGAITFMGTIDKNNYGWCMQIPVLL